jgi:hypothetical protein
MSLTLDCENCSSARPSSEVAPDRIRAALDELLRNPGFKASARNKRFLRFVVEQKLAGRSDKIKSYVIAVDVFGRGDEFDPATDPIVRIEATRLRAALDAYYKTCGRNDGIRFTMPKGSYVPMFETHPEHSQTQKAATTSVPKVVVPRPPLSPIDSLRSMMMIAGVLGVSMILARTVDRQITSSTPDALPADVAFQPAQMSSGLLLPSPSVREVLGSATIALPILGPLQGLVFPESD